MEKIKVKSVDEWVRNYVISTVAGMLKTKEHWMKQGFDEGRATDKALKYAIGQLGAGIDREKIDDYIIKQVPSMNYQIWLGFDSIINYFTK